MKKTKIILTLVLLTFGLNLQAQEGATEVKPQPIYKAPNGKAFPANWGAPPLRLTRDLRVLPGGYGRGSGTLARWIQENLDKDAEKNKSGIKPVAAKKAYPKHWGNPPNLQTGDYRPLPGGYGFGSSTIANWIQKNLDNDAKNNKPAVNSGNNQPPPPPIAVGRPAPPPRPIKPVVAKKAYPKHWGAPPRLQTKDLRPLPGGYGLGSSTLAGWIQKNMDNDAKNDVPAPPVAVDPVAPRPVDPPVFDPNAKARELAEKQAKEDTRKVKEGIGAWEIAKAKCKGNYSYKIGFQSWVGFGHETTIVVSNNKVTERRYRTFNRRPPVPVKPGGVAPPQPEEKSWVEKGEAIGANKQGAPAKTLDELYVLALETAKKPLQQFERRYIRFDKQLQRLHNGNTIGLLVSCYIMDRRIADDAPRNGLVVSSIQLGGGGAVAVNPPTAVGGGDCALCRTEAHQLHLGMPENGGTITVKKGSTLKVKLKGNPTTGFTWNDKTPADVLKLSGKVSHQAGGQLLGAPGMSTATYEAMKTGKGEIVLEYKRVFEDKPPVNTVKINIVVTDDGRATPQPVAAKVHRSANGKAFPAHWGAPPLRQTRDLRPLPGGYGSGSGTLARWIQENLNKDAADSGSGNGVAKPEPPAGNQQTQIQIATLKKEIAEMMALARRARFTRAGYKTFQAKLSTKKKQLAELQAGKPSLGGQTGVPTFEEWVKGGKKIPAGRVFIGGSPWFNESTGQQRTPEEVYTMLYGKKNPTPRPGIGIQPVRPQPGGRKPYPVHWGEPPRAQTRDLRQLPGGYGMGSGTLARWIQQNLDKDAAGHKPDGNHAAEITKIKAEITNLENLKKVARFTPEGLAKVNAQIKQLKEKLAMLEKEAEQAPSAPTDQRPTVSPSFAAKHPNGTYATGELLVGVEKGLSKEDSEKMLADAIPGLKIKKAMINNTILHVILPESTNVELAMAKLKTVEAVRYSEINGSVGIQPVQPGGAGIGIAPPRPQILPRTPPRKLGRPQVLPRR